MLITQKIFQWIFPHTCIFCHYPSDRPQDLCQACHDALPFIAVSCSHCANPLLQQDDPCTDCEKQLPPFDAAFALFSYQSPITKLIMELKFHERLINARILGELLAEAIKNRWYYNKSLPDVVIPVPLHPKRLRERGFNQAIEMGRPITKRLKIPMDTTRCLRTKYTEAQATLEAEHRSQNIKEAFRVQGDFTGLHVAILDDVTTTGHTLYELTEVIKNSGAKRIDVWCAAKTPKK